MKADARQVKLDSVDGKDVWFVRVVDGKGNCLHDAIVRGREAAEAKGQEMLAHGGGTRMQAVMPIFGVGRKTS